MMSVPNRDISSAFMRILALASIIFTGSVYPSSPTMAESQQRENYFPNTETLKENEMRVVALGTGTPNFATLRLLHLG